MMLDQQRRRSVAGNGRADTAAASRVEWGISMTISSRWARGFIAGLTGGLAWLLGLIVFFGPAQAILTDPDLQSAKFLGAFTGEPLPKVSAAPWVLPLGLLAIGVVWGWVFTWLSRSWSGPWWRRGVQFGVAGWALMVPWFEFYLPWNVMHEPAALVALEMLCWALLLLGVGLTISGVEALLRRGKAEQPAA